MVGASIPEPRARFALLAVLALTATPAVPPAGAGDDPIASFGEIRPGGVFLVPASNIVCSLAFLANEPSTGSTYVMTAGHCFEPEDIGRPVWALETDDATVAEDVIDFDDAPPRPFGEPVAFSNEPGLDWGIIRVYPEAVAATNPSVKTWTGPTGSAGEGPIGHEDIVCHYGWGWVISSADATRARCGRFTGYEREPFEELTVDRFHFAGTTSPGDSGSPLIHYATGWAIGIITALDPTPLGTAICTVMEAAAAKGYHLELVTAPYHPPPATLPVGMPALDDDPNHQCNE